jgi:transcriptional regulator with XRE-family HTH domain
MANDRAPGSDLGAWLGEELRRARLAAGYKSQDQLARKLGWERSVIAKAETGERPPSAEVAEALAEMFPDLGGGRFAELAEVARRSNGIPEWFGEWLPYEREAVSLRWWEPMLVPGLLQTEEYARAILGAAHDATEDNLDERVAARMERQSILYRAEPPELVVCLDSAVLHRCIGSLRIMHEQLKHLAAMMERPDIIIQIVPAEVATHGGLLGSFIIAAFESGPSTIYMEGALEGQVFAKPQLVRKGTVIFNRLRAEALPKQASRDLILKAAANCDG